MKSKINSGFSVFFKKDGERCIMKPSIGRASNIDFNCLILELPLHKNCISEQGNRARVGDQDGRRMCPLVAGAMSCSLFSGVKAKGVWWWLTKMKLWAMVGWTEDWRDWNGTYVTRVGSARKDEDNPQNPWTSNLVRERDLM